MPPSNPLAYATAKAVYDRLGNRQDHQRYEDAPVEAMIAHLGLETAEAVVEFGCGTGRWALEMLEHSLPSTARYWGCDLSDTMRRLARERLALYSDRVTIVQTNGCPKFDLPDQSCDRLISTYVLDLLSDKDIQTFLAEAKRIVRPGGRMGLVGISPGCSPLSALVMRLWQWVHLLKPEILGGCRPMQLGDWLDTDRWQIIHYQQTAMYGIASEVWVLEKR